MNFPASASKNSRPARPKGLLLKDKAAALGQSAVGLDVIHLSPQAKLMQNAAQAVAETPEVRPEKVLVFKDSVEQGTYEVNTKKVADKLIVEMLSEKA